MRNLSIFIAAFALVTLFSTVPPAVAQDSIPAPADVAAPPDDAERTDSGLAFKVLQAGTGDQHPGPADIVQVHYTGWTTDGKAFDSSVMRGEPARFPLDRVIPGWTEGLQLMKPGAKHLLFIPPDLAYGERGAGAQIGPNSTLIFEVELLEVKKSD